MHDFHDYFFCTFTRDGKGWTKTIRSLLPQELLAVEETQGHTIIQLARMGRMIAAVLLYRKIHHVALKEAVDAVSALKSE